MINSKILGLLYTTEEQLVRRIDWDVREIFATMVGSEISSSRPVETLTKSKDSVTAMVRLSP